MISFIKYFFALVFTFLAMMSSSQNEAKKWHFGNYGGLDFTTNPPSILSNGAMTTWEGCSSVADASANLLFYTNGVRIWNKAHVVMANGAGLFGDNSSSQSALIVKQPGNADIYFVFTTDGRVNGLRYSVVDMSLAAGMGSVTAKNILVSASSTERLCGTKHCNGNDIWVISHENGSDTFHANLVTSAGVNTTPVLSNAGTAINGSNYIGCMKVSPNGKKIGTALYRPPYAFEIFDFNASTGTITYDLNMPVSSPAYGCEFSPDGTKFYGLLWAGTVVTDRLRQWDLCAYSSLAVVASQTSFNATHTGQLQLAPDGKIYQARAVYSTMKLSPELTIELITGEPMLGVIHNPNAAAAALNFNNTGQAVNPGLSMFGLPNFVSGFYKTPVASFSYSLNPSVSCVRAFLTAPPLINATCSATSYTINNVQWLFGDPASGAANTSTLLNPNHNYTGNGTYNVRLILYNECGGVIDTLKQKVIIGGALLNNTGDFLLCSGKSLTLTAASASPSYTWSTLSSANSIVVTPTANTTYSLEYTDAFGCPRKSVQTITVSPTPTLTVLLTNTVCAGTPVTMKVSGALTYSWSNGSTNSTVKVTPLVNTAYTVTGASFEGCSANKVVTVTIKPSPVPVIVTNNTIVCAGSVATATVIGNSSDKYYWNPGISGPFFQFIPTDDQYIFSVLATYTNGCARYNTIRYNFRPLPFIEITGTSLVCSGQPFMQTAAGANTYTWSNGMSKNPAFLTTLTNTVFTVMGTDIYGCKSSAAVSINVKPSAVTSAAVSRNMRICEGERTFLAVSGGSQYSWKPETALEVVSNNLVLVSPSVSTVYSVNIYTDYDCPVTKTVAITVTPKPKFSAGRDTIFNPIEPMFLSASGEGTITWIGGEAISCAECPKTEVFPTSKVCYQAQTVGDYGCMATDEVCVNISAATALYIPNAFSPDGDGLNEEFFVNGFGISDLRLTIFDRWGEKVFISKNESTAWDGTFRGEPCQSATYYWLLEYLSANGLRQQKTGYVLLLRR